MSIARLAVVFGCAALACGSGPTTGALEPSEEAAKTAAASWLALVDRGSYEESWHKASEAFRLNMARFGKSVGFWVKSLETSRKPLGDIDARTVTRTAEAKGMPGASEDGRYLELMYESRFEEAETMTETLVMTLDGDGVWRMFNYVIHAGN
ncbi:MAG: DUF4019 domain-containing protein [Vicinamibacteria bacterium]